VWERVYEKWKASGVVFVGIGLHDKKEACLAFVERHHLSFPNGYDKDDAVAKQYGFVYQPYWAVIDKEGRLLRTGYGPAGEDDLVAAVKRLTGK
jgi:peroxiredoxin